MSRALVALAEQGVEAESLGRARVAAAYEGFISNSDQAKSDEAGKELIRAIFGRDAIAEDSVR
jgi:hypothetical protein